MRLWTIHPKYLDSKGLVAAWREALLAQKVLAGQTRGYRHHPQLARFQNQADPLGAIGTFLAGLASEAETRGYNFDVSKIFSWRLEKTLPETHGQLLFEWSHLRAKLKVRAPEINARFRRVKIPEPHPLFHIIPGEVRMWEKT